MNNVATREHKLPEPSDELLHAVRQVRNLGYIVKPSDAVADEALRWLAIHERIVSTPPTQAHVYRWLEDIALSVSNPPSKNGIDVRARGVAFAGAKVLSAYVFNTDTQALAIRTFKFWPSASEVIDLVMPAQLELSRDLEPMRTAAKNRTPPPDKTARPAPEPYAIPPAPEWAVTIGHERYPDEPDRVIKTQPPIRTVQEQIAILMGKLPDDTQSKTATTPKSEPRLANAEECVRFVSSSFKAD